MQQQQQAEPAPEHKAGKAGIFSEVSGSVSRSGQIEAAKAAQSVEVSQRIIDEGLVHTSLVLKEVDWFFNRM
jgi:hypothetical protein